MKYFRSFCFLFVFSTTIFSAAFAEWTTITEGIDYQEFTLSDPNNVFVTRMDRSNTDCIIDSCIAQGKLISGREVVSGMANRYEDIIGYWGNTWGNQYDVVSAINGDGFSSDQPTNGQITSGWYAKRFNEFTGAGFVWTLNRDAFLAECVRHVNSKNKIVYPSSGQDQNINGINTTRGTDQIIIYTPQYNSYTPSQSDGAEVLIELSRPLLIIPLSNYVSGTVKEIRQNTGTTPIPFDHVVLSADGAAAAKLLNNVSVGSEVRISQEITHFESDCSTNASGDFSKTYSCVGYMAKVFLKDSVIQSDPSPVKHPRTAVAYNDDYIFFVVCDGRSGVSVGMTYTELGTFCLNTLEATHGINQDGGGSSTLWVDGEVKNDPSDGSERYVTNGLMMIKLKGKNQSTKFEGNDLVRASGSVPVRLGPGTNYAVTGTASNGQEGTITEHSLNGISGKGGTWWKWKFGSTEGWSLESSLADMESGINSIWLIQ